MKQKFAFSLISQCFSILFFCNLLYFPVSLFSPAYRIFHKLMHVSILFCTVIKISRTSYFYIHSAWHFLNTRLFLGQVTIWLVLYNCTTSGGAVVQGHSSHGFSSQIYWSRLTNIYFILYFYCSVKYRLKKTNSNSKCVRVPFLPLKHWDNKIQSNLYIKATQKNLKMSSLWAVVLYIQVKIICTIH